MSTIYNNFAENTGITQCKAGRVEVNLCEFEELIYWENMYDAWELLNNIIYDRCLSVLNIIVAYELGY